MRPVVSAYIVLFTLGCLSVYPTLFGPYIFDDNEAITGNSDVNAEGQRTTLLDVFKNDFWGVQIQHPNSHKSYRPFTILTFRLEYKIWGRNPLPSHILNWLIHGLNCALVYKFLVKCKSPNVAHKSIDETSLWAAVIFAVHPIHVEPLGGLVGRADLMSSFIFLSTFILNCHQFRKLSGALVTTILAICGSLFKENAAAIVVFYIAFGIANKKLAKSDFLNYVLAVMLLAVFVVTRIWFQGGAPIFQPFDNPAMFAASYFTRVSSMLYIWSLNIGILICPIWLCYDWSMGCVDLIHSPTDYRLLLVLLFLVFVCRLVLLSVKSRRKRISLIIYASTFLPSSNIIFVVGFVLAERNLYLPCIGYSYALSHAFVKMKRRSWCVFVVMMFALRSVQRSFQWTSQDSLFVSGLDVCPNNAKIHYNLGTAYGESGNATMAIRSYKRALELRPDYYQSMNNLGNILRAVGEIPEAEIWLRRALFIKHDFAAAWMNLGIVLSKQNITEAMECYQNALTYRRYYPDCQYNLGNLYLDRGENDLAFKSWVKAISLKPSHSHAWINILILLEQNGKLKEARDWGIRATKVLPEDDTLQFLMGNILGKLQEYEFAKRHFENSINICRRVDKPIPSKYWSNLGVLYHRWGRKSDAIRCYEEALKIDDNLESARKNLNLLMS